MQHRELEHIFRQTLEDRRLTRAERQALSQLLSEADPSAEDRAGYLNRAFAAAAEILPRRADRKVLEWLLEVAKTLTRPATGTRRGDVAEALFEPRHNCAARLHALIDSCASRLEICVFTLTDDDLTEAVLEAHGRGVEVRVITDDEKSLDLGSDALRLRKAGIDLRFDVDPGHMHHKFALFDRRLLVTGSYNWTRGAAESNHENIVVTDDLRLVTPFCQEFDHLWQKFAPVSPGSA